MSALLSLLLNPRVLAILAVGAVVTFGWLHYSGLKSDLASAQEDLVAARAAAQVAIDAAETNAEALRRAEEEHRRTLAVMQELEEELDDLADISSQAEADILTAAPEDNPAVPGVLEQLRQNRFGG